MSVSDVAQSRKDTARVGIGDGAWPVADAVQTSRADMPARKSVLVPIAAPLCARITRTTPPCAQMRARARAANARTARERRTALHVRRTNRTLSKPTVCGQTNMRCERARYAKYGVDLTPPGKRLYAALQQIHRIRGSFETHVPFEMRFPFRVVQRPYHADTRSARTVGTNQLRRPAALCSTDAHPTSLARPIQSPLRHPAVLFLDGYGA